MVCNCFYRNKTQFFNKYSYNFNSKLYFLKTFNTIVAQMVKNPPAMRESWVRSLGWEDHLEKGKATHCVFWPGEFHGLYSPRGHRELDTTERLSQTQTFRYKALFLLPPHPAFKVLTLLLLPTGQLSARTPFSILLSPTESLRWEETDPVAGHPQVLWRVVYLFLRICEGMPRCKLSLFRAGVEADRTPSALSGEVP